VSARDPGPGGLRFLHQRERFFGALVRPLVWLFIFAAGFRSILGVSIIPPYETYILYEEYIVPGLAAMILLFGGMQSSLSMVYDREMGSMRLLMVSPFPRWYLLLCSSLPVHWCRSPRCICFSLSPGSGTCGPPPLGYLLCFQPCCCQIDARRSGLFLSSGDQTAREFRRCDELRDFPMFFASSALYPLWRIRDSSVALYEICRLNPSPGRLS